MQFADGQKSLFITDYFANLVIKSLLSEMELRKKL